MEVKWIIQQNLIRKELFEAFIKVFRQLDIAYETVTVIPFSSELPAFFPADRHIFYGSTTLMLNAYQHQQYRQGVFYDPDTFTVRNYLARWGAHMLNADGQAMPLKAFMKFIVDQEENWFVRPDADTKSFSGGIMSKAAFKSWYARVEDINQPELNPDTPIFVASVKQLLREWRCIIVNQKVVDASRYMLRGTLDIDARDVPVEMLDFAETCCEQYQPAPVFVMDIAETPQGYKIIECNCFNGTGFYQHNIKKVVQAVSHYVNT